MKKVSLIFDDIFCDLCSYEIEGVLDELPEIKSFEIHRKTNSVDIYLDKLKQFDKKKIEQLFNKEKFQLVQIVGG